MVFPFTQRDKADLRDSAFFLEIRFSHLTAQMSWWIFSLADYFRTQNL